MKNRFDGSAITIFEFYDYGIVIFKQTNNAMIFSSKTEDKILMTRNDFSDILKFINAQKRATNTAQFNLRIRNQIIVTYKVDYITILDVNNNVEIVLLIKDLEEVKDSLKENK